MPAPGPAASSGLRPLAAFSSTARKGTVASGTRSRGDGEWSGDLGILGDGPPQASSRTPRPGALSARRAASVGLRGPGWREEELGGPCGAATYLVPTQPSCRRSFALKMASRPRSAPRRSLGAGPGGCGWSSGSPFGPGRRVRVRRPCSSPRAPSASVGPGEGLGLEVRAGPPRESLLKLSPHGLRERAPRTSPEPHGGTSLIPRQAAPLYQPGSG